MLIKISWTEIRILLEKKFHPNVTPINNGFFFLLHLITHSLCENRHRCHGSWLKIVLKSTSQKKCCFFSACTRKKFWQNKSFLYLGNRPSGTYLMSWLTVAKNIRISQCLFMWWAEVWKWMATFLVFFVVYFCFATYLISDTYIHNFW